MSNNRKISQEIIFNVNDDKVKEFTKRMLSKYPFLRTWRKDYCYEQLSLFLEHPELVPVEYRGEKRAAVEATLEKISKQFGVTEKLLGSRAQETCSVCLETITDASVTQCGHVFCTECMQQLHEKQINCPLCRSKIKSFLKVSDQNTKGKIKVFHGTPYRLPEDESWGKKIDFIKKHKDADVIFDGRGDSPLLRKSHR